MNTINPKIETRNPRQISNSKRQFSKRLFRSFEFVISDLFRISILGFRIFIGVISATLFFPTLALASSQTTEILAKIPVQHAGRIKPFESFAREVSLFVTGKSKFEKRSPTELIWRWMAEPEGWVNRPLLPVHHPDLQKEFGMAVINHRVSVEMALNQSGFLEAAKEAASRREQKQTLSDLEQKRLELYERALLFNEVAKGALPGFLAHPLEPEIGWLPVEAFLHAGAQQQLDELFGEHEMAAIRGSFTELLKSIKENYESRASGDASLQFADSLAAGFESKGIYLDQATIDREVRYNRLSPFRWAWALYLVGAILGCVSFPHALRRESDPCLTTCGDDAGVACGDDTKKISKNSSYILAFIFLSGFFLHSYGFYLRSMISARPPVTNMYESIIWVSWAAVLFALILGALHRSFFFPTAAGIVASLGLILAASFPVMLDPGISPLVPVLRNNFWLTVHVLTITLSYGAFALAWAIGHAALFNFAFRPQNIETQQRISQYLYRALQIGVILLASGTVLGGVWANYSWGRFWGWDPKETWALIALLGYLAVLHGRWAGWLGLFGLAAGSVLAFLGIVMAWYGVNFVLAAGLHSYGFGGGGAVYVAAAAAADFLLVIFAIVRYKSNQLPVTSNQR